MKNLIDESSEIIIGKRCIVCNERIKKNEGVLDYEGWNTHRNCLGAYDAWIDDGGETIYKQGFEDEARAKEVIAQDYPYSKSFMIKRVRKFFNKERLKELSK